MVAFFSFFGKIFSSCLPMSQELRILRFKIDPDTVRKLPNRERNQVVGCMHAHNELVVLNRLLMFSLNSIGEGELHDHAHGVQMWTVMQLLTGKLFETWNMLVERFLQSNPEDPAVAALNDAHKTDVEWLKDYFGTIPLKNSALRTIRDKTGFHYDKLNLDQATSALTEHESMIYVAEHPANACYYLGSSLIFSAAFAAIADKRVDTSAMNQSERMKAGVDITLIDLNEVNLRMHNVLYGLIEHGLTQAASGSLDNLDRLDIPVAGAPKPSMVVLPMFLEIGQPRKGS
ncbi:MULTISPECIES: hypothetical protein [unclassified Bradyrhizobium]|uniref:hypothetical protein n=1 Tax=unclassified Bradyrhizobium TaxID=2631580 RepID=UPI0029168B40|nr:MULTISPECIES: hypothetical protein [unclassified Bradyrhizobium]